MIKREFRQWTLPCDRDDQLAAGCGVKMMARRVRAHSTGRNFKQPAPLPAGTCRNFAGALIMRSQSALFRLLYLCQITTYNCACILSREDVMARKSTAKTSTRKRAPRKRELVTAANVAGVGDIETFTDIRKLYDRLAKGGKSMQAPDRSRLRLAAASVAMETAAESEAPWFAVARGELGQRDYPGPRHNPRVVEYFNTTSLQANNDETSWCSAFVNWCMLQARQRGTNNAAARSWLAYERSCRFFRRFRCRESHSVAWGQSRWRRRMG